MRFILVLAAALLSGSASVQEPPPEPAAIVAAIDRGLAFLKDDALAWKDEHNCVSCHHASVVVWSMREARLRGHAVDEPVLAELTRWIAESGDGRTGVPRPPGRPKALNAKAVWFALVLWRSLGRPAGNWEPLARRIRERQNADGGWSQAEGMGSDAWATGQALYALAHAGPKPDEPAIARAKAFLIRTQREDCSWPMTSRPVRPGGGGAKSLVPITGAGSAWAVLGLVRSR